MQRLFCAAPLQHGREHPGDGGEEEPVSLVESLRLPAAELQHAQQLAFGPGKRPGYEAAHAEFLQPLAVGFVDLVFADVGHEERFLTPGGISAKVALVIQRYGDLLLRQLFLGEAYGAGAG